LFRPVGYNESVAEWTTVTVIDPDGRKHSLDVAADSLYDATHLFLHAAKSNPDSGLPVPTPETVFEVAAKGRIYKVTGAKLRQWIVKQREERRGPRGFLFSQRAVMD
jgi:hypothetical protein